MRLRLAYGLLGMLSLAFALPTARAAVLPVQGSGGTGVGFPIGDGTVLVTTDRLGLDVTVNGVHAVLLVARPQRGISLWRLAQPSEALRLAETTAPARSAQYHFLCPDPVKATSVSVVAQASAWHLSSEAWLARCEVPVPVGAPLIGESDGSVAGVAVATDAAGVVVAPASGIRLTCFDAGVSLIAPTPTNSPTRIVASWPFGGQSGSEFSHAEADRLEAWREIAGLLPTYQTSLATAGKLLYLGDREGNVYCIDSEGRTLLWSQPLEYPVIFPPVVEGDTLYVTIIGLLLEMREDTVLWRNRHWYASGVSHLYAFDRRTGEIRWRHVTGLRSAPVVQDDRVYFGGMNGYGALDAETGKSLWLKGEPLGRHETPFWYLVCPPKGDQLPVFRLQLRLYEKQPQRTLRTSGEAALLLVDLKTGEARQTAKLTSIPPSDHPFATACALSSSGDTALLAVGRTVRGYHLPEGKLLWERPLAGDVVPGAVWEAGRLLVPTDQPSVRCLDAATGSEVWSYTNLTGAPGSLLVQDGSVYLGSLDGYLYAISAETGALRWKLECPGGRLSGAPAIIGDSLYAAASDRRIYAVAPVSHAGK